MRLLVISALVWTAVSACNSDAKLDTPSPTATDKPAEKAPEAPTAPAPTAELKPPEDLPVPADFEQEAETSITKSNYGKELQALELEIDADSPK